MSYERGIDGVTRQFEKRLQAQPRICPCAGLDELANAIVVPRRAGYGRRILRGCCQPYTRRPEGSLALS